MKRILVGLAILCAVGCLPSEPPANTEFVRDFLGKTTPEFGNGVALNSNEPLSLEKLRGKVVWLEFSFLH